MKHNIPPWAKDDSVCHNPDNLTPEQVGEGYRLLLKEEVDGRRGIGGDKTASCWGADLKWINSGICEASYKQHTYRVPLSVPWPPAPQTGWVPKWKAGQSVIHVTCGKAHERIASVHASGYMIYGNNGIWPESEFEWRLPTPPEGMSWHRADWQESQLPEGWRPLLKGEAVHDGDLLLNESRTIWIEQRITGKPAPYANWMDHRFLRTRRPLPTPEPKPERWADLKQHFAQGGEIESMNKKTAPGIWIDCLGPVWTDNELVEYRKKIKPIDEKWAVEKAHRANGGIVQEKWDGSVAVSKWRDCGTDIDWTNPSLQFRCKPNDQPKPPTCPACDGSSRPSDTICKHQWHDLPSQQPEAEALPKSCGPATELDNATLVTVALECAGRLSLYNNETQFNRVKECREELLRRLDTKPSAEGGVQRGKTAGEILWDEDHPALRPCKDGHPETLQWKDAGPGRQAIYERKAQAVLGWQANQGTGTVPSVEELIDIYLKEAVQSDANRSHIVYRSAITAVREAMLQAGTPAYIHERMEQAKKVDELCIQAMERAEKAEAALAEANGVISRWEKRHAAAQRELDKTITAFAEANKSESLTEDQKIALADYCASYLDRGVKGVWHDLASAIASMLKDRDSLAKQLEASTKECDARLERINVVNSENWKLEQERDAAREEIQETKRKNDAALQKQREEGLLALRQEFGRAFDAKMTTAKRFAQTLGLSEDNPIFMNAEVVSAMARGAALVSEDRLVSGATQRFHGSPKAQANAIMTDASNSLYAKYQAGDPDTVSLVNSLLMQS